MKSPADLQGRLVELVSSARMVDLRTYEDLPIHDLSSGLLPRVAEILGHGLEVFAEVMDHYTPTLEAPPERALPDSSGDDFFHAVDVVMEDPQQNRISDLCFMARGELRPMPVLLMRLRDDAAAQTNVLSLCGSGLRKVCKAATAIENALCASENLMSRLSFVTVVGTSLQARRAYAKVWRVVLREPFPSPDTLRARLATVGTAIAWLRGLDIYPDLRLSDRLELRSLQERVLEWMTKEETLGREAGFRLWTDVECVFQLLKQVNRRWELVEHDRRLIEDAATQLLGGVAGTLATSETLWRSFQPLFGLDDELDTLILSNEPPPLGLWRDPLERLRRSIFPRACEHGTGRGCAETATGDWYQIDPSCQVNVHLH